MTRRTLLDLNVLIALAEPAHIHHQLAQRWFATHREENWGICPITEMGFVGVTTNPTYKPVPRLLEQAIAVLQRMKSIPGYAYWEINESRSWVDLTAPFAMRIAGHQQVTDAYLLGLAIKENGVLITFDKGIRFLAGPEFAKHVLVLE